MYLISANPENMLENSMKTAISYIRWSSPQQSHGESLARQLSKTKEFCAQQGLTLDMELVDEAKSAYKAKHTGKDGKLKRLLERIKDGQIPKGTVLIVESLDRLSRGTVMVALRQFLEILEHDVEIVTLMDEQWYSKKSLGDDSMPLMMSIVIMMRAHNESAEKAYRLGLNWKRKRLKAVNEKLPMTSICPGWLKLSADKMRYEVMPDRVKRVKLMFWLWNRGWSRQRIAQLFNTHELEQWSKKERRTYGWHHSYIDKILHGRAVLGEFVPFSTKDQKDDRALAKKRKPVDGVIKGYYPQIIGETVYAKAQMRCGNPKGPIGKTCGNLFQGLLRDGHHEKFSMYYRDHGSATKWQYVSSDYRRFKPTAEAFTWRYDQLETTILDYITDLDWSSLTVSTSSEVRILKDQLAVIEAKVKKLNSDMTGMVALGPMITEIPEFQSKVQAIETERTELRRSAAEVRSKLKSKESFMANDGKRLIKDLAAKRNTIDNRLRLRLAIRQHVKQIELFKEAPKAFVGKFKEDLGRCIKIIFTNGAERWIFPKLDVRVDGKKIPTTPVKNRDGVGIALVEDGSVNMKATKASGKFAEWKKGKL